MRVRCLKTKINNPWPELLETGWWNADGYLTIGKEYDVFAIHSTWLRRNIGCYLICDDVYNDQDYYWPLYIPNFYFEVIDNTKPPFWAVSSKDPDYEGPPEIGPDKRGKYSYYEAIVDGDPAAVATFRRIRAMTMSFNKLIG